MPAERLRSHLWLVPVQNLPATSAKPELRKLYLQMKKDDPESFIPEVALRLLQ